MTDELTAEQMQLAGVLVTAMTPEGPQVTDSYRTGIVMLARRVAAELAPGTLEQLTAALEQAMVTSAHYRADLASERFRYGGSRSW